MSWKNILQKFGFNWSLKHIMYRLDWSMPNTKDLKLYLKENIELTRTLVSSKKLPNYMNKKLTRDQIMMKLFDWVTKNIKYVSDQSKFGIKEKWENMDSVIETMSGDCESQASLLYCLAIVHNINPLQIKLIAGDVKFGSSTAGHCWVQYMADYDMNWYNLDPAYDPKNKEPFEDRIFAIADTRYINTWFEVTLLNIGED